MAMAMLCVPLAHTNFRLPFIEAATKGTPGPFRSIASVALGVPFTHCSCFPTGRITAIDSSGRNTSKSIVTLNPAMATYQFVSSLAATYSSGSGSAIPYQAPPESVKYARGTTDGYIPPELQVPLNGVMNFESLLGAELFSDIRIQCGSVTFPAHKAILAGRSHVFKTMLMSGLEEVKSGLIHVTDMTAPTFDIILRYLYTGQVKEQELECDSLLEIVHGAEKYGLEELKNYCFGKLVCCINGETAGAVAIAVHLYGAGEAVKDAMQKFIQANFFRLVKEEEFRKMVKKYNNAFF